MEGMIGTDIAEQVSIVTIAITSPMTMQVPQFQFQYSDIRLYNSTM